MNTRPRATFPALMTMLLIAVALASVAMRRANAQAQDSKKNAVAAPAAPAAPAAGARPALPQGSFEVVEWVVLVVDPNRPNANDLTSFKSTAPGFARGRRAGPASGASPGGSPGASSGAAINVPSPVGVIRLVGAQAQGDDAIDVLLNVPSGRLLGQWPAGKARTNRQLWDGVTLRQGTSLPLPVDAGHWFETLRRGEGAAPMSTPRWSERFLMYDVEVAYPNALRVRAEVAGGGGTYRIANGRSAVMHDVEVYAPAEGGWRVGGLKELPATKPPPATKPAAPLGDAAAGEADGGVPPGPATDVLNEVFRVAARNVKPIDVKVEAKAAATQPATAPASQPATRQATTASTRPATTTPSTRPATRPAVAAAEAIPEAAWRDINVAGAKPLAAADAVAPWRKRLTGAGVLPEDVEVILATLGAHALDPEQLTVAYRIDAAELDRLLPLEVVPMPSKVTRVGLVIVKNIDPAAGERIARLVDQLGDADWEKREAAQAKLAELGAGAKPKLTDALKHKDVEVVYRVERLLEALNTPQ